MRTSNILAVATVIAAISHVPAVAADVTSSVSPQVVTCNRPLAAVDVYMPSKAFESAWLKEHLQAPDMLVRNLIKVSNCFTDAWAAKTTPKYSIMVLLSQTYTGDPSEMKFTYALPFVGRRKINRDFQDKMASDVVIALVDPNTNKAVNGTITVTANKPDPGVDVNLPVELYGDGSAPTDRGKAITLAYIDAFNQVVERLKISSKSR